MAFILTPRFAQAYQAPDSNPFGSCGSASLPICGYRTTPHPKPRHSPFASFFSQLDDFVNEIDRESQYQAQVEAQRAAQREAQREAQAQAQREAYEALVEAQHTAFRQRQAQIEAHIAAQREAHRQRQLRKRTCRAQFAVTQNEQGWQVDAHVPGFQQENISIEVTDENTLKISGNTEWSAKPHVEDHVQAEAEATPAVEESLEPDGEQVAEESVDEKMEGITLEETAETDLARPATPNSDTSSQRSYQATVEDDFEDLGPEASTLFSTSEVATPSEPKGKEKAVEHHETVDDPEVSVPIETAVAEQTQPEAPAQLHEVEERPHGFFERTYRFPERIDADGVRASFKDGVLSIAVPRAQAQRIRRISIL